MRHFISVIVFLALLSPFSSSGWSSLRVVGELSLYINLVLLFLVAFFLFLKNRRILKSGIFPLFFLLVSFFIIIFSFEINRDVFSKMGQLFFICFSIFIGNNILLKLDDVRGIVSLGANFSSALLFVFAISGFLGGWEYAGGFDNPNTLGMITVGFLAWALMKEGGGYFNCYRMIVISAAVYIIFISMSRTAFISMVALIVMHYISSRVFKNKLSYWPVSLFFLILPILVVFIYSGPFMDFFDGIYSRYFAALSEKRFESGRDAIWNLILENGKMSPILGFGFSVRPGSFSDLVYLDDLSAHNLYLQIFIQSGLIGIFAWVVLFVYVFSEIWKRRNSCYGKGAFCFFISLLIIQCFEVSLTQNNFNVASNFWILIMCVLAVRLKNNSDRKIISEGNINI